MRVTTQVTVGEGENQRSVQIKELTVREMREAMKSRVPELGEGQEHDLVAVLYRDDVTFYDLTRMTDLKIGDFDELTQSELRAIEGEAREVNADFFAMLGRLRQGARALTDATELISSGTSNADSAS